MSIDMIGTAPISVQADREVQDSIWKWLTLPDNQRRTSEQTEVLDKIFFSDFREGKIGAKLA